MWVRSLYGAVEHLSSLSPSPGCEEKDRLSLAKIATVRCVMQDHAPRWWSIRSTLQAERWCNSGTSICHRIVLSLDLPSGGQWSVICLCMRACMHACVRACVCVCVCVYVCVRGCIGALKHLRVQQPVIVPVSSLCVESALAAFTERAI